MNSTISVKASTTLHLQYACMQSPNTYKFTVTCDAGVCYLLAVRLKGEPKFRVGRHFWDLFQA